MAAITVPAIPEPLLAEIFELSAQGSISERGKLARVCTIARDVVSTGWAEHAVREWGPLDWTEYFQQEHNQQVADAKPSQWGALFAKLEAELRPRMSRSIKQVRRMQLVTPIRCHPLTSLCIRRYFTYAPCNC